MDSCCQNKPSFFDPLRKKNVVVGEEEKVRQWLIGVLTTQLGYPASLMITEKELRQLPFPKCRDAPLRRIDLLCYYLRGSELAPLLLIECKETLSFSALDQVLGYNYFIEAPFVAVVGQQADGIGCHFRSTLGNRKQYEGLPRYEELLAEVGV